jgi:hypothetical protein
MSPDTKTIRRHLRRLAAQTPPKQSQGMGSLSPTMDSINRLLLVAKILAK